MKISSGKFSEIFDFKDDYEVFESSTGKFMGQFGNPMAENSPSAKYKFLECCGTKAEDPKSLVNKLHCIFYEGLPIAAPISMLRTNELGLVRGVLQMLQGFSSSLFYWDDNRQSFCPKNGIYLSHLSQTSLSGILSQFVHGATCLQLVENFIKMVEVPSLRSPPTLKAFANSVSARLKRLRNFALEEEMKMVGFTTGTAPTLLGLVNALSSMCSEAEYLLQVVHDAIPGAYFDLEPSVPAAEMAVHILDTLYKKLNEVCLVQGGEEEAYQMLLYIFVGSLLPYVEGLDTWLYDGTLDDPFEELFFYANSATAIGQADFWEKSYQLRLRGRKLGPGISPIAGSSDGEPINVKKGMFNKETNPAYTSVREEGQINIDLETCPLFLKDIAKAIISAGKSLQLIRHVPREYIALSSICDDHDIDDFGRSNADGEVDKTHHGKSVAELTLSEVFCVSLVGLVGNGSRIFKYFGQDGPLNSKVAQLFELNMDRKNLTEGNSDTTPAAVCLEHIWCKFLVDTMLQKGMIDSESSLKVNEGNEAVNLIDGPTFPQPFCPENPVITVCRTFLDKSRASWDNLNISRNVHLPPLDDEGLRQAIFGEMNRLPSTHKTDYMFGFQFGESEYIRSEDDTKTLEELYPFPTLLPSFQENLHISEFLPFQKNSSLTSRVLNWIQGIKPKATPLPVVVMQECLVVYIKKQVDYIGKHILLKLMNGWRLMDELEVLRAIYLLGSGDLLQQFLSVLFDKLDKGEAWDDDFELNTVLQESIRNSADDMLLSAPDSLVVSITKQHVSDGKEQHNTASLPPTNFKGRNHCFGIDALDLLKFTYKVSWPLELIANLEAIKKYNQVMAFLLKVKRAKYVLDKARRWMWKGRGTSTINRKHHWLVEQKLLHFVDAFHQYVMDRVFHSSWLELCEGMASAGSLDEVIEVHEAYLLSIQRQCFVVPDKLWALIANRIKSILGLALDFYSIQQTLYSGGAALAIKARCEMEVDRIEKQFDDCIAFLLRVLSFKLNVGHFPHLADLVTRINYNYFYMSDNGNLLTVPGSDTAVSKLGKAFPVRPT